ncbi:hypothetical protein [Bradyrhizobium betae]|uniref:Uncharacterized protein n=1 Tax=Bradyrhizobium betae TaxID=244734 RepID=A0A4Q1V0G2_9BRAD|nr:hypothetical protein [Bradyrhizobium betae]RXT44965.1 hypothetical protein B5V03_20560 [Bradyrhizobium betae]
MLLTKRRPFKQQVTLEDRLCSWARTVQDQAAKLPPGPNREAMIKKARQADIAAHLIDWVKSPGLRPPK